MIFGPYSTGWRDETARMERMAKRREGAFLAAFWLSVIVLCWVFWLALAIVVA